MIDNLLRQLDACIGARKWAAGRSFVEILNTCPRGDWLLWLFSRTNPSDLQVITLVKGHCVNTIRHLMDSRHIAALVAIDAAIAFGEGKISKQDLDKAAHTCWESRVFCRDAFSTKATEAAAYTHASDAAAYAAIAFSVYNTNINIQYLEDALTENRKLTADICRKYLPLQLWNIVEEIN